MCVLSLRGRLENARLAQKHASLQELATQESVPDQYNATVWWPTEKAWPEGPQRTEVSLR